METIIARLQTPADDNGVRKDIHLITDADAITVQDPDTGRVLSLTEKLEDIGTGIITSSEQPDKPCTWFQLKSTDPVEG